MSVERRQALLFPGQGISPQEIVSFHSDLREINERKVRETLRLAEDTLNEVFGYKAFSLHESLEDPDSNNFEQTSFTQLLIHSLSSAGTQIFRGDLDPEFVIGHSLGEYGAITFADVITKEEGMKIVAHRGKYMQEACEVSPSRLVAIVGLSKEKIEDIYRKTQGIEVALINSDDLIVIGCNVEQTEDVRKLAEEQKAIKTFVLNTPGAFHTSRMAGAASELQKVFDGIDFKDPKTIVVLNLTGEQAMGGNHIKRSLVKSMMNPVQWALTLDVLKGAGTNEFIETGPGNSLAILNRRNGIDRSMTRNILD